MAKKYLWLMVSNDEYENTLAVADSVGELSKMIGKRSDSIKRLIRMYDNGQLKKCRYRKCLDLPTDSDYD